MDASMPFDPGPRPELTWLSVASLVSDPSYQRSIESRASKKSIATIAEGFCWAAFGTVLVAENDDGTWSIIDGQHRVAAAALRGLQRVPCVVVPAASVAEQAQIFLQANVNRVQLSANALFHARVAAGEPDAVAAKRLCGNLLIEIPRYPIPLKEMKPGQTLAIADIVRIAGDEDSAGIAALECLAEAYAEVGGGLTSLNIRAATSALRERPSGAEAVRKWFGTHAPPDLVMRYGRGRIAEGPMVSDLLRAIERAAHAPRQGAEDSFIKPPTRAQLMGSR